MKFLIFFIFFISQIFANELIFDTLSAEFTQIVQSEKSAITYKGNFKATQNRAFWHYETPNLKDIYFSKTRVVIIEPELEQAIVTNIQDTPNVLEILKNAKADKSGNFHANFDGVDYEISLKSGILSKISYNDKLDNKITINFSQVRKNGQIQPEILEAKIPNGFDIITQ